MSIIKLSDPHAYYDTEADVLVPSVTQILEAGGLFSSRFMGRAAAERGSRVHALSVELDKGRDVRDWRGDDEFGYLAAWKGFKSATGCVMVRSEFIVGSAAVGCAGTVDRLVYLFGHPYVLDLKTGRPAAWHRLQLAGYAYCMEKRYRRIAVYLQPGSTFKLKAWEDTMELSQDLLRFGELLEQVRATVAV